MPKYHYTAAARTATVLSALSVVAGIASFFTFGLSAVAAAGLQAAAAGISAAAGIAAGVTSSASAIAASKSGQKVSKLSLLSTLGMTALSVATLGVSSKVTGVMGLVNKGLAGVGAAGAIYGAEEQIRSVATGEEELGFKGEKAWNTINFATSLLGVGQAYGATRGAFSSRQTMETGVSNRATGETTTTAQSEHLIAKPGVERATGSGAIKSGVSPKATFTETVFQSAQRVVSKIQANPEIQYHGEFTVKNLPKEINPYAKLSETTYNYEKFYEGLQFARKNPLGFKPDNAKVTDAYLSGGRIFLKVEYTSATGETQQFLFWRSTGLAGKENVPTDRYYLTFGVQQGTGWVTKGSTVFGSGNNDIAKNGGEPFIQKMAEWLNQQYTDQPPSMTGVSNK